MGPNDDLAVVWVIGSKFFLFSFFLQIIVFIHL